MNEIKGDILKEVKYDLICFTSNSTLKKDGSLVMGRGNALSFKNKFKDIDKKLGRIIEDKSLFGLKVLKATDYKVGAFQTKINWVEPSTYEILENSKRKLEQYINKYPNEKIAICYPGIENGKLNKEKVKEIFIDLDIDLYYL